MVVVDVVMSLVGDGGGGGGGYFMVKQARRCGVFVIVLPLPVL